MNRPEQVLQIDLLRWLQYVLPDDVVVFAIPNGGYRKPAEAAILRGLGVVPGIPDLCVCHEGRARFIELKALGGRLSPAQREVHERLRRAGFEVEIAHSIEDVATLLDQWAIPQRRTRTFQKSDCQREGIREG